MPDNGTNLVLSTIAAYSPVISTSPQPLASRPLVDVINTRKAITRFTRGRNLSLDYCVLCIPLSSKRDSFLKWLGDSEVFMKLVVVQKDGLNMACRIANQCAENRTDASAYGYRVEF